MKYWLECLGLAAIIALMNYYPIPIPVIEQLLLPLTNFGLAMLLGLRFPDVDLYTPGLKHRSAVTHSVLLPWLFTLLGYPSILAGLAMGMAIHILADVFPKAWVGGALVKMPLFGSLGKLSPFWLMINCLACLAIALQTTVAQDDWVRYGCFTMSMTMMLWYMIRKEKSMPPLLTALMIIGVLLWNHYSPDISSLNLKSLTATASWNQGSSS